MAAQRSGSGKLTKKHLNTFRKSLEERGAELRKILQLEVGSSGGEADPGDNSQKETQVALSLRDRERLQLELRSVESALRQIKAGTFGLCTSCEEPIGLKRLEVMPTACLCLDCQCEKETLAKRQRLALSSV